MQVGLCENCKNVEIVSSRRGGQFYLCTLAARDSRFAKYPRLPVLNCPGYVDKSEGTARDQEETMPQQD